MAGLVLIDVDDAVDFRIAAFAIGADEGRVQGAFPGHAAADDPAEVFIFIAPFEQQPVRIGIDVASGDGIPQFHAQFRIQGLVGCRAVFGMFLEPFCRDLAGRYAFGLCNLGTGQAMRAFGHVNLAVVFAMLDHDTAIGAGFQHVEIALAPAFRFLSGHHVDLGLDLLGPAIRIGDFIAELGIGRVVRIFAQHQRQGVVGIDADMAMAGLGQDDDAGDIAVPFGLDGQHAAGFGRQLFGLSRKGGRDDRPRLGGDGVGRLGIGARLGSGLLVKVRRRLWRKAWKSHGVRRSGGCFKGHDRGADDLRGFLHLDFFDTRGRGRRPDQSRQGDKQIAKQHSLNSFGRRPGKAN